MPSKQAGAGRAGLPGPGAIDRDLVEWLPKSHIRPESYEREQLFTLSRKRAKQVGVEDSNKRTHKTRNDFDAYRSRIEYLRSEAVHDGYALNSDSETDFQKFVLSASGIRKGNLVLMDNGNLRAVWRDKQGNHLGLQFLGGGMVQYVIFKRRLAAKLISRGTGRDTFAGLKQQINAFNLDSMLYE